ncbi:unnamed protein product, partial [Symbiodinium sp. KB8]
MGLALTTAMFTGMFVTGPVLAGREMQEQQNAVDQQAQQMRQQLQEYEKNMNSAIAAEQQEFTSIMADVSEATSRLKLAQAAYLASQTNFATSFATLQVVGMVFIGLIALVVLLKLSGLLGLPLKQRVLLLERRQEALAYFARQAALAPTAAPSVLPAAAPETG